MSMIDYIFLAICVTALVAMLACSKVIRAVLWETLRYPLQRSHIEIRKGNLVVTR